MSLLIPYECFPAMAELLEALDTAVQEALLPTGRRGVGTPMAVLKRLCGGDKERLTTRLSIFSVQSKRAGGRCTAQSKVRAVNHRDAC